MKQKQRLKTLIALFVKKSSASHYDRACLEAQLDEHYKCDGKKLKPADGTGPFEPVPVDDTQTTKEKNK